MKDEGNIMVFEAIIVAVLILTSVIFYTTLQRPTQQIQPGGIDLEVVASDTLLVLEASEFEDPLDSNRNMPYEEWLLRFMQGETDVVALIENFIEEVLPTGTNYQLRLHNGYADYLMLPLDEEPPRNARTASRIALPDWSFYAGNAGTPYSPGDALDFSGFTALRSPAGTDVSPDGSSWLTQWTQAEAGQDAVPTWAMYGIWEYEELGCIPCYLEIQETVPAEQAVYFLQLVVWFGV